MLVAVGGLLRVSEGESKELNKRNYHLLGSKAARRMELKRLMTWMSLLGELGVLVVCRVEVGSRSGKWSIE